MTKLSLMILTVATAVVLAGCGSKSDSTATASTAAGVKPYPLDKCPVSDEKLGAMGEPVVFVKDGQEIKLCCKNCRKDFDADPAKYLTKLAGK